MAQTVGDLVREAMGRQSNHTAVHFRTRAFTYLELGSFITRTAAGLERLGVEPGDRVAIYMHNIPAFIFAYYATLRLGAIPVPLNITYQAEDIQPILADCEARVVITIAPRYERIAAIRQTLPALQQVVVLAGNGAPPDDTVAWEELISDVFTPVEEPTVDPNDVAVISYGRTGVSRGVVLSHKNLVSAATMVNDLPLVLSPNDTILLPLPLFSLFAMTAGMNAGFLAGASLVLLERFEVQSTLDALRQYGCTGMVGTPSMYAALVGNLTPEDGQHLRFALSSTAALPPQLAAEFTQRTGATLWQCYGTTETSGIITSTAVTRNPVPNSVGAPLQGIETRLVDDRGRDVPLGATGELICRGANNFMFYLNDEEATRDVKSGGWLHTGDLAHQDEQGLYYITGRL